MLDHIKENRVALVTILIVGMSLVLMSITMFNQTAKKSELEDEYATLTTELNTVNNAVAEREVELQSEKTESVKKATGLDPSLIETDTEEAKEYFTPAFDWKSGDEYEKVRQDYISTLGKDNTFTKTYLPEDTKIDTNDGQLSYIDFESLKATMKDIYIVPMTAEGDRIRYVAFVRYYMHKTENDLNDTDALETSEAIIEFTAAGGGDKGDRTITEVNARAGFSSSLED